MSTLRKFLESGQLGPLVCGISPEDVEAILGPPQDVSISKKPLIWQYGPLELAFSRHKSSGLFSLVYISVTFRDGVSLPKTLPWEGWLPSQLTSRRDFSEFLKSQGLTTDREVREELVDYLVLPSGIHVNFDEEKLHSIQFGEQSSIARKQLSVTLPLDVLDVLKREARQRSISTAELGAQWLTKAARSGTD